MSGPAAPQPGPGAEEPPRYSHLQVPGLPGVYFREQRLELAGRRLSLLAASAIDVLGARGPGPLPYWAVAWPAGLALARHLAAADLTGARILEVGCGVGISALGAALAGARVLATDNQVPALRLALMNARRNDLPLRAAAADWRAWPFRAEAPGSRFDRVVGSDVTYEPEAFDALLSVLDAALRPGGEAHLTDPGRLMTSVFQQRAVARGWTYEARPLPREASQPVFLYTLRR